MREHKERDMDGLLGESEVLGDARVEQLVVVGESAAGENYGSSLLMLEARLQNGRTVKMVAKKLPPNKFLRDLFNVEVSFLKEVALYKCVVPAMRALQREFGIAPEQCIDVFPEQYGARCALQGDTGVTDDAIIVLENLFESGFRCGDRTRGLDMTHCLVAVRGLARFHAMGIALKVHHPDVFWGPIKEAAVFYLHNRSLEEKEKDRRGYQDTTLKFIEEQMPELQPYFPRLRRAISIGCTEPTALEPFCTFAHYDFWVNNMMFGYDENGVPRRFKILDYQTTEIASPVADLVLFLYSSTNSNALARSDELLQAYHSELMCYLKLHGTYSEQYNWENFKEEYNREAPSVIWLPFVMVNTVRAEKKMGLENVTSMDTFSSQLGLSDRARERFVEMVHDWNKKGFI